MDCSSMDAGDSCLSGYVTDGCRTDDPQTGECMAEPCQTEECLAALPDNIEGVRGALHLWSALSRAYHTIAARLQADVARHDITLTEFEILRVLRLQGPLLLGEVQRRILVSSGGITYLVDRLEAKGLVVRQACERDRRARYAALTPEGDAFISRVLPEHVETIETLLGALNTGQQEEVSSLLMLLGRQILLGARAPARAADRS
ncbi:MAG: MarR family transcriptional regulator [Gemmatimonadota bacterium]|nr:MarR family transcriptional regulator [Gemmatimonadota bacterium]